MNAKYGLKRTGFVLTLLRILVGWHFLYEGVVKLANPNWSSASYLLESKWLFSDFFHWIVNNQLVLRIVDSLNVWGLFLIGLGLFLGFLTRIAGLSGALLLLLYYVANPPFIGSNAPVEGHYFLIDKNVIEGCLLILFAFLPKDTLWSLDRLIRYLVERKRKSKFPELDDHPTMESTDRTRRELVKNLAVMPVLGAVLWGIAKKHGWMSHEENNLITKVDAVTSASMRVRIGQEIKELKGKLPKGKIKGVDISRIIVGGNLVSGFAHSRDLIYVSAILQEYFTDEKVIETLWLCEACGINTAILRTDDNTIRILEKYRKRGGKIQWLAQTYTKDNDFSNMQKAIDHGAIGAFLHGGIADTMVKENRIEMLDKAISYIRDKGILAGVAAHSLEVPRTCQKENLTLDFYMKTFHTDNYWSAHPRQNRNEFTPISEDSSDHNQYHDNIWCVDANATAEFFAQTPVPWIAYKILAAGAIHPKDGLKFAFESGADFVCMGMFDFQVVENANIAFDLFRSDFNRHRQWHA